MRLVNLPGLPPKGDVSDWLAAGSGRAELEALVRAAPARLPARPDPVSMLQVPADVPPQWRVRGILIAGDGYMLIAGDGASFKSTAAVAIAGAAAGGYPAFDAPRFKTAAARVLIISAEDSAAVLRDRVEALVRGHGWDRNRVLGNVFIFPTTDVSLADPAWCAHVEHHARQLQVGLIILDPLSELLGGDENSNSEARPLIKFMRRLAERTGAAIILVHHAGKAGDGKRTSDRIRGASAFFNNARSVLFFEQLEQNGNRITVTHLKMNRAPKLPPFVLTLDATTAPDNRAQWMSATLRCEDARTVARTRADDFVLAQVTASPRTLTTTDLKQAAVGSGLSGQDIGTALARLQASGEIGFDPGPRGARYWYRATLPERFGKVDETTLPTLPDGCPATSPGLGASLPGPLGAGKASWPPRAARQGEPSGEPDGGPDEDELYAADERLGIALDAGEPPA